MKKLTILFFLFFSAHCFAQYVPEWAQSTFIEDLKNGIAFSTVDQGNNIYLTSYKYISNTSEYHAVTAKFNSTGDFQWVKTYISNFPKYYRPAGIYCDNSGYIYVIGSDNDNFPINNSKIYLLKYDASGNLLYDYIFNLPGRTIRLFASTFDNISNIYITGYVRYSSLDTLIDTVYTAKINTTTGIQWAKTYKGSDIFNVGNNLKLDGAGNLYVICSISLPGIYRFKTALLKYDISGNLLWSQNHSFDTTYTSEPVDLALDNSNNIYITGYSGRGGPGSDSSEITALKYNSGGQYQWGYKFNYSNIHLETGKKILVDNSNIYIYGVLPGSYKLLKLNTSGQLQWANTYTIKPSNIYFDNTNKVLLSGAISTHFRTEIGLQRINSNGISDWQYNYSYIGTGNDVPHSLKIYNDSKILTIGNHNSEILISKFTPSMSNSVTSIKNNINKIINDNQYTYDTMTFSLPPNSFVKNVYVSIDTIIHPYIGDLEISLLRGNQEDTLIYRRGGPVANYIGTNLGDTCFKEICNSAYPYTGYFKPCKPLSQFVSLNANGQWILKIRDRIAPNTGTLKAWKLNIQYEYPIGITQISSEVPKSYALRQNYPNPFNPETNIKFSIAKLSNIKIVIYDVTGREIETLVNQQLTAGTYETNFNASGYSSGIYFYKLITDYYSETRKMILIK